MSKFQDIPERPDWAIFSKILGRDIQPPKNYKEEGASKLKELLMESYTTNPESLLKVTCCGGARGKGPLGNYWSKMNYDKRIVDDSMRYCMSYLWTKRADGKAAKARNQERGTSGNAITYWDPTAGGVVAYMRERVQYAIAQYVDINNIPKESLSLDKLGEYNLEITNTGDFVRALDSYDDISQEEDDKSLSERFASIEPGEVPLLGDSAGDINIEDEIDLPVEDLLEASGILHEERELHRKSKAFSKEISYESENRPDLVWMEESLGIAHDPEPDFEDRMEQMQELALQVVEKHCVNMPQDEIESIKEDLAEWQPKKDNFLRTYPDVVQEVEHNIEVKAKSAHIVKYVKNLKGVDGVQSTLEIESKTPESASASDLIEEKNLWRARSTPESLESPTRPDFLYLQKALRLEEKEGFEAYESPRRLQAMGYRYIDQRAMNDRLGVSLRAGAGMWDPTKNFFHEQMSETISKIGINERMSEKEVQQAMMMMNPDSNIAKSARLEAKIEANIDLELAGKNEEPTEDLQMDLF